MEGLSSPSPAAGVAGLSSVGDADLSSAPPSAAGVAGLEPVMKTRKKFIQVVSKVQTIPLEKLRPAHKEYGAKKSGRYIQIVVLNELLCE